MTCLCRVLLQNASLLMSFGRRYGMVGRNGLGKTTLLRAMSRYKRYPVLCTSHCVVTCCSQNLRQLLYVCSGHLKIPSHISILHVEQEVVGDDTEAIDSVLQSDTKRTALLAEEKLLTQQMAAGLAHSLELYSWHLDITLNSLFNHSYTYHNLNPYPLP